MLQAALLTSEGQNIANDLDRLGALSAGVDSSPLLAVASKVLDEIPKQSPGLVVSAKHQQYKMYIDMLDRVLPKLRPEVSQALVRACRSPLPDPLSY